MSRGAVLKNYILPHNEMGKNYCWKNAILTDGLNRFDRIGFSVWTDI